MIWSLYCGYCSAVASALENDFVSSLWTLSVTLALFGEAAICELTALA